MIEEFIDGEPLNVFLLHQTCISPEFLISCGLQLCDIFKYLHGLQPVPVIYRDLKPDHILLCGTRIKLIDFNVSVEESVPGNNTDHFGNAEFSAPESYFQTDISTAADIYSIGCVLNDLSSHLEKPPSRILRNLIRKAMDPDPLLRYETVEELEKDLTAENQHPRRTHLVSSVAVAGSHPGCGATHLAIALVSTLNYHGISAVYYESNTENSLRQAAEFQKFFRERDNCFCYHFFKGFPSYGPGVLLTPPESSVHVYDLGSVYTESDLAKADLVLLVATGGLWRLHDLLRRYEDLTSAGIPCKVVCSRCGRRAAAMIAQLLSVPVFRYPEDFTPFRVSHRKAKFFLHLLGIR